MKHLGELAKLSARDINGPLSELNQRGRIVGVIYETGDGGIHVDFWQQPTPKVLQSLRHTFRNLKNYLPVRGQRPKECN